MDQYTRQMAQEALDLHQNPQSHWYFRGSIEAAIEQVVGEEDVPELQSLKEVENHRQSLIRDVTAAVEQLQADEKRKNDAD